MGSKADLVKGCEEGNGEIVIQLLQECPSFLNESCNLVCEREERGEKKRRREKVKKKRGNYNHIYYYYSLFLLFRIEW